jgi:alpha-mannosidase
MTYQYCYIYQYEIAVPKGAATLTLPDNDTIKIFAITAVNRQKDDITLLQPLFDDFKHQPEFTLRK